MTDHQIDWVEIAGRQIAAHKLVCVECGALDLGASIDTTGPTWKATCTKGHSWEFFPEDSLA